jgi:hypothetical protein
MPVGRYEGEMDGEDVGKYVGLDDGCVEGREDGSPEGTEDGRPEGPDEGELDGLWLGMADGDDEGWSEGDTDGQRVLDGEVEGVLVSAKAPDAPLLTAPIIVSTIDASNLSIAEMKSSNDRLVMRVFISCYWFNESVQYSKLNLF